MFQRLKCIISRVLVMFFLGLCGPVLCLLNYFHEVSTAKLQSELRTVFHPLLPREAKHEK